MCVSTQLPGDVDAAGPGTLLGESLAWHKMSQPVITEQEPEPRGPAFQVSALLGPSSGLMVAPSSALAGSSLGYSFHVCTFYLR